MIALSVPLQSGGPLKIELQAGQSLFIVGANGAGKSSLMQHFCSQHHAIARRISAHRQTWFESESSNMTAQTKKQTEQHIQTTDRQPDSRWKDQYASQRAGIAIFDLIDAENVRARRIAAAVDSGDLGNATAIAKHPAPITVINHLFELANLPLTIAVEESERVVASKHGSAPFSIAELSDGERNSLLIAANVLTVREGTLILIDEPERHLHRSIISPLLTHLFASRPDCIFVVSTHEVMLCADHLKSPTLLVRECFFDGRKATHWNADLLAPDTDVSEDIKLQVLGSRRKLLFIEGTENSLDMPMYSILFPECSVTPVRSCRDVEQNVRAIRTAEALHWVSAWGIVDNDSRPAAQLAEMEQYGVFATDCFSVEALYFDPDITLEICTRQSAVQGFDVKQVFDSAVAAALQEVASHTRRLASRVAEKAVRHKLLGASLRHNEILEGETLSLQIDVPNILNEIERTLSDSLQTSDFRTILRRFPIRETAALDTIARTIGFKGRRDYERAVLKLVADDADIKDKIRSMLGGLSAAIAGGTQQARTNAFTGAAVASRF